MSYAVPWTVQVMIYVLTGNITHGVGANSFRALMASKQAAHPNQGRSCYKAMVRRHATAAIWHCACTTEHKSQPPQVQRSVRFGAAGGQQSCSCIPSLCLSNFSLIEVATANIRGVPKLNRTWQSPRPSGWRRRAPTSSPLGPASRRRSCRPAGESPQRPRSPACTW